MVINVEDEDGRVGLSSSSDKDPSPFCSDSQGCVSNEISFSTLEIDQSEQGGGDSSSKLLDDCLKSLDMVSHSRSSCSRYQEQSSFRMDDSSYSSDFGIVGMDSCCFEDSFAMGDVGTYHIGLRRPALETVIDIEDDEDNVENDDHCHDPKQNKSKKVSSPAGI